MPKVKEKKYPLSTNVCSAHTKGVNSCHLCRRKNGLKPVRKQKFKGKKAGNSRVEIINCPMHLFPHLIHVIELTRDFMDRAAFDINLSRNSSFLRKTFDNVQIKFIHIPALSSNSILGGQKEISCKTKHQLSRWPYTPTIRVLRGGQIETMNGVLMNEKKYTKTKCMLEQSLNGASSEPDIREIHETLTGLLETPIWELLTEIKNSQKLSKKQLPDTLSMELNILLDTVKHSACQFDDGLDASKSKGTLDVPEKLKDYLYRKREVGEFFTWRNDEFWVFIKHKGKERYIEENLRRMFPCFFSKCKLNVLVSEVHLSPCLKQGEKIYPDSSKKNIKATEKNGYGTLGGFVRDRISPLNKKLSQPETSTLYERVPQTKNSAEHDTKMSKVYALTCSHVCEKDRLVYSSFAQSAQNRIGKCVFSSDLCNNEEIRVFADLALIEIDKDVWDQCQLSMMNHEYKESNVGIFKEDLQNVAGKKYVYKIGATTAVRKGLIMSSEFHKCTEGRREMFVVSGVGPHSFCEEGDSGSLVFFNENSSALDTIKVIGMFWGKGKVDCNVTDQPSSTQEKSFCFRLDKAFEILHENGFDVRFENQLL